MRRKRIRGASSIMFGGLLDSPYSDHKYLRPSSKATGSWNQKRNEYLYMWTQNITVQQWARAARMQPLSTDSALDNTPAWHIPSYCHAVTCLNAQPVRVLLLSVISSIFSVIVTRATNSRHFLSEGYDQKSQSVQHRRFIKEIHFYHKQ